jgi:sugar/nucleoside kinase (ribokinase family)
VKAVDLLAVGDVMADVVAPAPAALPHQAQVEIRAGGSAVNAAAAAVASGRTALVVGCVGDDPLGRFVCDDLACRGLDAQLAVVAGARTGRVVVAGSGVVAERGANARFATGHLPSVEARAVLVSGYQLLRDDSGPAVASALALGGLVGVDLGGARLVRAYGSEPVRRLLASVDVVFGDEAAVAALGGLDGVLSVTTLGPDGVRAGGEWVRPPRRVPGELFGAGDALAAVVLLALADGLPVATALEHGCAAALALAQPE